MRVLVTGGAGFIGSAVCRYFVSERGATVLNVDKLTHTSSLASLAGIATSPRYSHRKADVADRARISALMQAFEPEAVIHLASTATDARTEGLIDTNVVGTIRLLEAAHDYWWQLPAARREQFRVLHVSCALDDGLVPATPYAASKASAEQFAGLWHRDSGLPVMVSRGAATYGPYQFPDSPIPGAILAAIEGAAAEVDDPAAARDWLFVDDHVRALEAIIAKGTPGETYDIGSGVVRTVREVCEQVTELSLRHGRQRFGRKASPSTQALGGSAEACAVNAAKLKRETGWRAEDSLESGLSKTVRWYLANTAWWSPLRQARFGSSITGLLKTG